ncbi:MAG TPA: NAD(P)-dependent oxidoreductase [Casimicrobiaceae bacterium]|jgi:3-hydroxyisobutyrate dehydrogenase-like beta-hydroxyacid dehydrogenase
MTTSASPGKHRLGWIGTGRMGFPMAQRLAKAGCDIAVWNRTRAKAEPLAAAGAKVVDSPAALADRDIVFTMVSTSHDLEEVVGGTHGLLSHRGKAPKVLVDCSTVSADASAVVREAMQRAGGAMLAAPVSGNAKVVKAGRLSIVASGPKDAYAMAEPYLAAVGEGVSYVGDGELARIVKICHNVLLGVVSQSLAEITVLAERAGVPRHAFLDFINKSVMGSTFTRYKTPGIVKLDFTTTFTPVLLRKDLDLGLSAARELGVPMPLAAATRELVQALIGAGFADEDFMRLLTLEARGAGIELKPENVVVSDGLTS